MVGVPFPAGAEPSAGSFTAVGTEVLGSTALFLVGVARLGMRKRPPNLLGFDFLPSPSVTSVSDMASGLFSRLLPRLLKNEERRFSIPGAGGEGAAAAVAAVVVTGAVSEISAAGAGAAAAGAGSADEVITGSPIWGAVADTGLISESLAERGEANSLAVGDVGSFLPKRLPNIEFRFVGFGAVSGDEVAGNDEASVVTGAVSSAAIGFVPSRGITGSATAREAIPC